MLELQSFFEAQTSILDNIGKLIGYGSGLHDYPLIDETDRKWALNGSSEIYLLDSDSDDPDDGYAYNVDSYSAKGERYFMGSTDEHTIVMASCDNSGNTYIFALSNELKVEL